MTDVFVIKDPIPGSKTVLNPDALSFLKALTKDSENEREFEIPALRLGFEFEKETPQFKRFASWIPSVGESTKYGMLTAYTGFKSPDT